MKRREFITLVGGGLFAWPIAVRAQHSEQISRIGVLMNRAADDPTGQVQFALFQKSVQELGLRDGGNVRIDIRWGANIVDLERIRVRYWEQSRRDENIGFDRPRPIADSARGSIDHASHSVP
jgi:hypothetical protein